MAAHHLTILSSPEFSQAFNSFIATLIRRVETISAQAQLSQCDFSDADCDCHELATVHELASEREFCERHFGKVVARG